MTVETTLRALATGSVDPLHVWGGCRLEHATGDAFGIEAIGAALQRSPVQADGYVECPSQCVLIGDGAALFADVIGDVVVRVWRTGSPISLDSEPAVRTAFDPDLAQARGGIVFDPDDHPDLAEDAYAKIIASGRALLAERDAAFRVRGFVIRAFGDASAGAALVALVSLGEHRARTPGLARAIVVWRDDDLQTVIDPTVPHGTIGRLVA